MVVGRWHGRFVHIPMALAVSQRNQVAPDGDLWLSVLEATGQPRSFGSAHAAGCTERDRQAGPGGNPSPGT
jgi:hypothetical protein